jgi:hypothetical protein
VVTVLSIGLALYAGDEVFINDVVAPCASLHSSISAYFGLLDNLVVRKRLVTGGQQKNSEEGENGFRHGGPSPFEFPVMLYFTAMHTKPTTAIGIVIGIAA